MRVFALSLSLVALLTVAVWAEDEKPADKDKPQEKVTYADHVVSIFRRRCGSCHNANDRSGGLVLDDYAAAMEGGSSGTVIEPGDAEGSYLYSLVTHEGEPSMPPNQPKLPDEELALIRKWIDLGALQNAGSVANIKKKPSLAKITVSTARPEGPPPLPEAYLGGPLLVTPSSNSVTALAASPWAPVAAVSGHEQIALYDTRDLRLLGVLPFPEGQPHILKFSRNGSLLMAGGGQGGASGKVVVYDVVTGERKMEVGAEYDLVLAADISPDHTMVALGGPKRLVRVYSTDTGELLHEQTKHTDWVTAIAFSPDGVLLASGDRSNGLIVWEAHTGREYLVLGGHSGTITDLSWRPDSNVLASASEDRSVRLWEMKDGNQLKNWNAHGEGVSAIDYVRDGRIVTVGRDRTAKLWEGDGKAIRTFGGLAELGLEVAFDAETDRVLAGDWAGTVHVFDAADGKAVGQISSNPPTLAEQIEQVRQSLAAAESQAKEATDQHAAMQAEAEKKLAEREAAAKAAAEKVDTAAKELPPVEKAQASAAERAAQRAETLAEAARLFEAAKLLYEKAQADHKAASSAAEKANAQLAETEKTLKQLNDTLAELKSQAEKSKAAATLTAEEQQAIAEAEAAAKAAKEKAEADRKLLARLEALRQEKTQSADASK